MGANLVGKVLIYWTHVSDRAFRILVRMAHTALDKPTEDTPADHYFGGRELLAMALRGTGGTPESRFRIVARVVAELIDAGAIRRVDSGRTGHAAVYRLTLGEAKTAEKTTDEQANQDGQFSHPQGGQFDQQEGGQFDPIRVANLATPRNQEEPIEELKEEEGVDLSTSSHPPRATPTPKQCPTHRIPLKPRPDGQQACALCRRGVPPPNPSPPDNVIDLDSRRTA